MADQEVKIASIKTAPPPPELPILGKFEPREISFIGKTNYVTALDEKRFIFGVKRSDRKKHMYIIGKSGAGKSKLLELLIRQDIVYGKGVCVLDPRGELIDDLLDFIPEERVKDTVVVNLVDEKHILAFNPLADIAPRLRHHFAEGFLEIMRDQFGSNWTGRMEHILRFAILALFDQEKPVLGDLIKLLNDETFRASAAAKIEDHMIRRFWEVEFEHWMKNERAENEAIAPLLNKLSQFLADPFLKQIFQNSENKIDFKQLIDDEQIVLINVARGILGKENASFMSALFLLKIKEAGMERVVLPKKERRDFYLYIDEFHNLVNQTFEGLMFDGRKYGIVMTIAHQYLGQIIEHFRGSVFGNVGTLIVFRVGGEDAKVLEGEFSSVFKARDMIQLGKQEFYIKTIIDDEVHDPFSARTLAVLPPKHLSHREIIINQKHAMRTQE